MPHPKHPKRHCEVVSLRTIKAECEHLRERLQKSILDNPQTARKAAQLIALWIEGRERRRKKAG